MTAMITTSGVTKRFGERVVLADIDLQVAQGECLGLGGSNGSGRTTLLRILATLVRPTSGHIEIAGIDAIRRVYDVRAHVMYASGACIGGSGLRIREYLDVLRAARLGSAAGRSLMTTDDVVARAELPANAVVDVLSTGVRQQLAVAGALLVAPDVMLLDDPFGAMDSRARLRFIEWLTERRDRGATLVAALNDERDMSALCHRVLRLEAGRLLPARRGSATPVHGVAARSLATGGA